MRIWVSVKFLRERNLACYIQPGYKIEMLLVINKLLNEKKSILANIKAGQ